MKSYEEKLVKATEELRASGMWKINYDPPVSRLMRFAGIKARPLHYTSPMKLFVGFALYMTIALACFLWFFARPIAGYGLGFVSLSSILAGLFFGTVMSTSYKFSAKRKKLSHWEDL